MQSECHRDAWDDMPTYEALTRHDIWALRRQFIERLWEDVGGLRVLEVGSGPAHDSVTFAQRGATVTALDCSQRGLACAELIYRELDLPIETVAGDVTALPFGDGRFDIAFNAGVLEHFEDADLERVIDEMIRVVRPGGTVLAFCPNRYNVFYQHHLKRVSGHRYAFERAFAASELSERFRRGGLGDVRVSGVHVHPAFNYVLPAWLPKHHRIEPAMRWCFSPMEVCDGLHRLKSLVGQDFVVWGTRVDVSSGLTRDGE